MTRFMSLILKPMPMAKPTMWNAMPRKALLQKSNGKLVKTIPYLKKLAKISYAEAEETALAFHPGKVVSSEREISFEGDATYEFDIQSIHGYEVKVDVNAATGEIEEANIELYEIGVEKEN